MNICDDSISAISWLFSQLHNEAPDLAAIWNMNFDIPCIINNIVQLGEKPAKYFSDPNILEEFQSFTYFPGFMYKMIDGNKIPIHPALRKPSLVTNSKFDFVDAMCFYAEKRRGKPMECTYQLSEIVKKYTDFINPVHELNAELPGVSWHIKMQKEMPYDYVVGSIIDNMSLLALDKVTQDLSVTYFSVKKNTVPKVTTFLVA